MTTVAIVARTLTSLMRIAMSPASKFLPASPMIERIYKTPGAVAEMFEYVAYAFWIAPLSLSLIASCAIKFISAPNPYIVSKNMRLTRPVPIARNVAMNAGCVATFFTASFPPLSSGVICTLS